MYDHDIIPELFYLKRRDIFVTRIVRPGMATLYIISRQAMEHYIQSLEWEALQRDRNN